MKTIFTIFLPLWSQRGFGFYQHWASILPKLVRWQDYHGERWPAVIKITDMLDGVAEKNLDIWNLLTNKGCYLASQAY